jgi:hypothetical protein
MTVAGVVWESDGHFLKGILDPKWLMLPNALVPRTSSFSKLYRKFYELELNKQRVQTPANAIGLECLE